MSTMKALILNAYSSHTKQSLSLSDVPKPTPASNQLLIRVRAASINPLDYKICSGELKMIFRQTLPAKLGLDVSGVVEAIGAGETKFKPGDEVIARVPNAFKGTFAEFVVTPSDVCVLKPTTLSHEEASCLPHAGLTAFQALSKHEGTKDMALIPAGLGGVGFLALQLAKAHFGFKKTATTVSTSKVDVLKHNLPGVDQVIDYTTTPLSEALSPSSVDFVLDTQGVPKSFIPFLKPSALPASIISIAAIPPGPALEAGFGPGVPWWLRKSTDMMDSFARRGMPKGVKYEAMIMQAEGGQLGVIAELAERGLLKPLIGKVFPLEEAVEAFELAKSGKAVGKVVINMD